MVLFIRRLPELLPSLIVIAFASPLPSIVLLAMILLLEPLIMRSAAYTGLLPEISKTSTSAKILDFNLKYSRSGVLLPGNPGLHIVQKYIFQLFRLEDLDMGQPCLQGVPDFVETAYHE